MSEAVWAWQVFGYHAVSWLVHMHALVYVSDFPSWSIANID